MVKCLGDVTVRDLALGGEAQWEVVREIIEAIRSAEAQHPDTLGTHLLRRMFVDLDSEEMKYDPGDEPRMEIG
jgi:hypothetical protein